jgi:type II secretory pathway pseudopilin PulG
MNKKNKAFSLLEALVASGISAIIITSALGTISQIYSHQKQINLAQQFYSETRFFMERIAQLARNNTIDYDRYFVKIGPDTSQCTEFNADQMSTGLSGDSSLESVRAAETYPNVFYWDTNDDDTQDRNLGGVDPDGNNDPCVKAWHGTDLDTLFLINGARNMRLKVKWVPQTGTEPGKVLLTRWYGADTNGDLIADKWGKTKWDSGLCKLDPSNEEVLGKLSEETCWNSHDEISISPYYMNIENLTFDPSPDQDPFLSFRVDAVQVHPSVFIKLKATIFEPKKFGLTSNTTPKISFQTGVSSRVFGNNRR